MNVNSLFSSAAAVAVAAFLSAAPASAAMSPALPHSASSVQRVDCAVGFHLGPAGACILGVEEEHHDRVIEHRATDEGCATKTVKRTDDEGNSVTHTRTNCD